MGPSFESAKLRNRWVIAIMGTLLQLCLGTVYAWSFFQKPLVDGYGWSNTQAAWAFSLAICFLGLAAAWGGINLPRFGPRRLAMTGAVLYAVGNLLAGLALGLKNLPLLYIGFGVVGGIGLGLGYVTPVATAAKWFPDRKGLVTGMVIMGFGFGALFMSKLVAPVLVGLLGGDLSLVFAAIGLIMLALSLPAGWFLTNPPDGYLPDGWTPPPRSEAAQAAESALTADRCLLSGRFARMWLIFFFNITAGIMFIGFQSPMLQDLLKPLNPGMGSTALAAAGASLIAISSIFNGVGRFLWGGISDRIGRIQTFRLILGSQALVFLVLQQIADPLIFGLLVCYVLLCYGGGFGSMPSFVLDVFGMRLMPVVYGTILTAWSLGGIAGPQIVAFIKDNFPADRAPFFTFGAAAVLLGLGFLLSLTLKNTRFQPA
jgi:MFS transporter, OFA family, oxalate/formate antiporter